jgi:hypothetical protein
MKRYPYRAAELQVITARAVAVDIVLFIIATRVLKLEKSCAIDRSIAAIFAIKGGCI